MVNKTYITMKSYFTSNQIFVAKISLYISVTVFVSSKCSIYIDEISVHVKVSLISCNARTHQIFVYVESFRLKSIFLLCDSGTKLEITRYAMSHGIMYEFRVIIP